MDMAGPDIIYITEHFFFPPEKPLPCPPNQNLS